MAWIGTAVVELVIMALLLGVFAAVLAYRAMRPQRGRFAIPVRDVDAHNETDKLERRLLDLEKEIWEGSVSGNTGSQDSGRRGDV